MRNQAISSTDEASHEFHLKKNSFFFNVCVLVCVAEQHPTEKKGMSEVLTKRSKGPFQKGSSGDRKKIICNT